MDVLWLDNVGVLKTPMPRGTLKLHLLPSRPWTPHTDGQSLQSPRVVPPLQLVPQGPVRPGHPETHDWLVHRPLLRWYPWWVFPVYRT